MQNGEKIWNTMPIQPEVLMGWLQTEKVSREIHLLVDCLWLDLVAGIVQQALGKILAGWLLKKAWEAALQPNWLGKQSYSPRLYPCCSREHGCGHAVQLGLAQEGGCTNHGQNEVQKQDRCSHKCRWHDTKKTGHHRQLTEAGHNKFKFAF